MLKRLRTFLHDGWVGVRADAAKAIVWALIGLAVYVFAYVIIVPFWDGVPNELKKNNEFDPSLLGPWLLAQIIFEAKNLFQLLITNPFWVGLWLIISSGVLITNKFRRDIIAFFTETARRKDLLEKTGLFEFWPNADRKERADQWNIMSDRILAKPHAFLYMIGSTGWETFGEESSPLHNAVLKFTGDIRIILLNEDSQYLPSRAASVMVTPYEYKRQIRDSIKYLKWLRKRGHHVELHVYDSIPNWKMIFTPKRLWLQHYHNDYHVEECPVNIFYSTEDLLGLYHAFSKDFKRIWDLSEPVDLS